MNNIDPKSLRIGNKLRIGIRGIVITVSELYESEFKTPEEGFIDYAHPALSGIPLSEQELIRLGFNPKLDTLYMFFFFMISKVDDGFRLWINHGTYGSTMKYVHELQNLYYDLKKEELSYKVESGLTPTEKEKEPYIFRGEGIVIIKENPLDVEATEPDITKWNQRNNKRKESGVIGSNGITDPPFKTQA